MAVTRLYFPHTNQDPNIETIGQFTSGVGSIGVGIDLTTLLDFQPEDMSVKNIDILFQSPSYINNSQFIETKKKSIKSVLASQVAIPKESRTKVSILENLPFDIGVTIFIPISEVNPVVIKAFDSPLITYQNFKAFVAKKLKDYYSSPKYVKAISFNTSGIGGVRTEIPQITVWVWSRALSARLSQSDKGTVLNYDDQIINITPFIDTLSIDSNFDGGAFNFTLPPITCQLSKEGNEWKVDKLHAISDGFNYVGESNFYTSRNNELQRSTLYFHQILQANDVVFIQFGPLESTLEKQMRTVKDLTISKDNLPGSNFDMIGLIDQVSSPTNPAGTSIGITVSGRDLTKLIIDDGIYFYPLDYIPGGLFANELKEDYLVRFDGKLITQLQLYFNKVSTYLKFVFNALTSIKVTSDSLWSHYQDKSTKFIITEEDKKKKLDEKELPGIWKIVRLLVDPNVENRILVDRSIGNEHGSLINGIKKVCQEPFVEFFTDTIGDRFYFIVRKQPFDEEGIKSLLDGDIIHEDEAKFQRERVELREFERQTVVERVTQNKPVFTLGEVEIGESKTKATGFVVEIEDEDIVREDLQYGRVPYSWYLVRLMSDLLPKNLLLKGVHFKEYADIWGERSLDIPINYTPFTTLSGREQNRVQNTALRQGIHDLRFLVQCYAYYPFIRHGTIIINEDRRIKKGTMVRLKSTKEVFYVTGVGHNYSIGMGGVDRTTTLRVDRGMVEKYVFNRDINYFNIINTTIDSSVFNNVTGRVDFNQSILGKWKVNPEVFHFFLKKNQFV